MILDVAVAAIGCLVFVKLASSEIALGWQHQPWVIADGTSQGRVSNSREAGTSHSKQLHCNTGLLW